MNLFFERLKDKFLKANINRYTNGAIIFTATIGGFALI